MGLLPSRVRGQRAGLFLIPHVVQGRKMTLAASPQGPVPAPPGGDAEGGVVHPSAFSLLLAPDASFQEGGSPASHCLTCQEQQAALIKAQLSVL